MNAAYRLTGSDLSAALAKMLNGPHSAHRKAEEALERMTQPCAYCNGSGEVLEYANGVTYSVACHYCDGTGEIVTDEPDEDARVPEPVTADDWWYADDSERYLADLEAAE